MRMPARLTLQRFSVVFFVVVQTARVQPLKTTVLHTLTVLDYQILKVSTLTVVQGQRV